MDGVPNQLFGYEIKTRMRILLSYLLPAFLELNIYNVLMAADIALVVQHFRDGHNVWSSLTLSFILAPAILCFLTIIGSPSQWLPVENDDDKMTTTATTQYGGRGRCCMSCKFLMRQLFNLIIFPIISIYRLVWSFLFYFFFVLSVCWAFLSSTAAAAVTTATHRVWHWLVKVIRKLFDFFSASSFLLFNNSRWY